MSSDMSSSDIYTCRETKVAQAVVRVVQADNAVVAVAASPKRTSTGTIMKLMLGVHIIAGLALYLHHTNNLFPSIFHCPIEGYISMGVIALLHLFSR